MSMLIALAIMLGVVALMAATVDNILGVARGQIGTKESPRGSNRQKYGAAFGRNGVAWCGWFVTWVFLQCGIDLRKLSDNPGYTPNLLGDLRDRGWGVPKNQIRPGDIVFFDFPDNVHRTQHVGIAELATDGRSVTTIDGNTAGPGGSQSNGGMVMRRTRPLSQVSGVVRVPLAPAPVNDAIKQLQQLRLAINYAKLGFHDIGSPTDNINRPGRTEAIRLAQTGINRWADQFSAMTGNPNPPDIAVTGQWDDATRFAVAVLQKLTGKNELGVLGPQTWEVLYPS